MGTNMASEIVAEELRKLSHDVTVKDISEIQFPELEGNNLIILGSPSWDFENQTGQPHQHFIDFINASKDKKLTGGKFAIFGLGDSTYEHFCGAVDHLEAFVKQLEGVLVVESLRIDGFYFNQTENEEKIKTWTAGLQSKLSSG